MVKRIGAFDQKPRPEPPQNQATFSNLSPMLACLYHSESVTPNSLQISFSQNPANFKNKFIFPVRKQTSNRLGIMKDGTLT